MIFAPGTLLALQFRIVLPGRGDKHLHTMKQIAARMCEQFQYIVQLGRITSSCLQDGQEVVKPVPPKWRVQCPCTSLHPVPIALKRIDLAIVSQQAQRLR